MSGSTDLAQHRRHRSRACLLVALGLPWLACESVAPPLAPDPLVFEDRLSASGLYANVAGKHVVERALEFTPAHPLWSDAAQKRRWLLLPPGGIIDTSDPEHWRFPIGTRLFKEFALDGHRLETRLIIRVGDSGSVERDYLAGAYLWDADERDAIFVPDGAENVLGTAHDVPSRAACWRCHVGEPGHILGLSAMQLGTASGPVTLASLTAAGLLSHTVPADAAVPGDAVAVAALGWLHANCGHCHNEHGNAWPQTPMVLRLATTEHTVEATQLYQTTVGAQLNYYRAPGYTTRIVPGDPEASAIVHRDGARGSMDQMPPLATELPDADGLLAVRAWIAALPAPPAP